MSYHNVKRILIFFLNFCTLNCEKQPVGYILLPLDFSCLYFTSPELHIKTHGSKPLASFVLLTHNVVKFLVFFY